MSDTFVLELPLILTPYIEKEIAIRLSCAGQLYNAILGELLKRLCLMRQSKKWTFGLKETSLSKRKKTFKQVREEFGFSEYSTHSLASNFSKGCHISSHLDSFTIQKIATRAFHAVEQYMYGTRGIPRFKGFGRIRSVEGKSNKSGIRWVNNKVIWNIRGGKKLSISALLDLKDKYKIQEHALGCRVKFVRLVVRRLREKARLYAQLILEGKPKIKPQNSPGNDVVGLDIGPSTIAVSSKNSAFLQAFCYELEDNNKKVKQLQKRMDRSRRASNPQNYNDDGTIKKGMKRWFFSKRYKKLKAELEELYRVIASTRKKLHGKLENKILRIGKNIHTEKLSYKAFQKLFGKSVGLRAPGMFISRLRRKAESAGGKLYEFSTYTTRLSQTCICGSIRKKKLSERYHHCHCGLICQRDLLSAFLARFVKNGDLDIQLARTSWDAAEPLLERAMSRLIQQTSGGFRPASFGIFQRQSLSHAKGESFCSKAIDVVGVLPRAMESC